MRCPFCDHEMDTGRLDAEGLLGCRPLMSVVWRPAARKGGEGRRVSGFVRRRAAHSCAACGALVPAPTNSDKAQQLQIDE